MTAETQTSTPSSAQRYLDLHDDSRSTAEDRKARYTEVANHYYDLATDFYLFGWGESFHFGKRHRGESFRESILRHQLYLAHRLDLRPGQRVVDLGCGVAGPLRGIARATGAAITGVNNNAYQVEKAKQRIRSLAGCDVVRADFMKLPFPDGHFDAAYAIEATCHAPDRTALFTEIRRVLKPGGFFASYEWCMTDRYDPQSADHVRIKRSIERGDGLPDLVDVAAVRDAAKRAGLDVHDLRDLAPECDRETPWYLPLTGGDLSLGSVTRRPLARAITRRVVGALEAVRLAPAGTGNVSGFLNEAADALVEGGRAEIFTPMAFLLAQKTG